MTDLPRSQIGHYEITREIGRGGMGVVYLARDMRLHRRGASPLAISARYCAGPSCRGR